MTTENVIPITPIEDDEGPSAEETFGEIYMGLHDQVAVLTCVKIAYRASGLLDGDKVLQSYNLADRADLTQATQLLDTTTGTSSGFWPSWLNGRRSSARPPAS